MGFTKLEKDMAVIAALDNEPNDVGGLTAEELKEKFDEAGKAVKAYLNEVLLRELEGSLAAEKLGAVLGGVAPGQRRGAAVDVRHHHVEGRVFHRQRHAHRAPAAAQVQHPARQRRQRFKQDLGTPVESVP